MIVYTKGFMSVSTTGAQVLMAREGVVGDLVLRVGFRYMNIRERKGHFRMPKIMKRCRNALFT